MAVPGYKPTIGGGGAPDEGAAPADGGGEDILSAGETAASRSILKAVTGGNADDLTSALKAFAAACGWGPEGAE